NQTDTSGEPWFEEVSARVGVGRPSWFLLGWGCAIADFDHDGWVDVFSANGHIFHQMDDCDPELVVYRQANSLFRGTSTPGAFDDWGHRAGPAFAVQDAHRASAIADLDDDGDLDLVLTILDEVPAVLWNRSASPGHWLQLRVDVQDAEGQPTVLAVGARATVTAGSRSWPRDVQVGSSFLATEDPRLHFGLGDAATIDRLELRLPGRPAVAVEPPPAVGRTWRIVLRPQGEVVSVEEAY
ncbi:MAG: ASPIC/UnbV domain-containing protein, partial [Planctomycetota bacterium]